MINKDVGWTIFRFCEGGHIAYGGSPTRENPAEIHSYPNWGGSSHSPPSSKEFTLVLKYNLIVHSFQFTVLYYISGSI